MSDADGVIDTAKTGLKGKIGPVPVWLIAGILGVAAVVGYYVYSKKTSAVSDSDTTTSSTASTGTTEDGSIPTSDSTVTDSSYSPAGYISSSSDSGQVDTSSSSSSAGTNAGWLISAATAIADQGSAGYVDSFVALTKYVNGDTITAAQKALVDQAIAIKGYPPEGLDGISVVTAPATATATNTDSSSSTSAGTTTTTTPAPSTSTGTTVVVKNPVKSTPAPTPSKTATAAPGQAKAASSSTGEKFTLEKVHKGYLTADAANSGKGSISNVQPGSYYVYNKVTRSTGTMINLTRVKGVPGTWINP